MQWQSTEASVRATVEADVEKELKLKSRDEKILTEKYFNFFLPFILSRLAMMFHGMMRFGPFISYIALDIILSKMKEASEELIGLMDEALSGGDPVAMFDTYRTSKQGTSDLSGIWKNAIDEIDMEGLDDN